MRFFPAAAQHRLPEAGAELFLHIQDVVREDAFNLYGFVEPEEKVTFQLLTGVSGIGPKVAHTVLAGTSPGELARAVAADDIHRLIKLPGIGKKTAERICLELKDKLRFLADLPGPAGTPVQESPPSASRGADAVSALVNLGYPQVKAEQALERVREELDPEVYRGMPLEELLRQALRALV